MWRRWLALLLWALVAAALPVPAAAADPARVVVTRSSATALPTAHVTATVSWETELADPDGAWTAGTDVVVPAAWNGRVATVTVWVNYEAVSGGNYRGLIVLLNADSIASVHTGPPSSAIGAALMATSTPRVLATGDVVTLQVRTGTNGIDAAAAQLSVEVWGSDEGGGAGSTGPPGPTGPSGPTGPAGPAGEACPTPEVEGADCIVDVNSITGEAAERLDLMFGSFLMWGVFIVILATAATLVVLTRRG
jgi:hypothetical protein